MSRGKSRATKNERDSRGEQAYGEKKERKVRIERVAI